MNRNNFGERARYSREDFRVWLSHRPNEWQFYDSTSPIAQFMQYRFWRKLRAYLADRQLVGKIRRKGKTRSRDIIAMIDARSDV
jgi:hypothetical protein